MRFHTLTVCLLAVLLTIACSSNYSLTPTPARTPSVAINNHIFTVEIADQDSAWEYGLMNRTHLDQNAGMLFVFPDAQPRSFWMKNTLIPLDMIFIDDKNQIVEIIRNARPCDADPCQAYSAPPSKYVLEINAGLSKQFQFLVGDKVVRSQ